MKRHIATVLLILICLISSGQVMDSTIYTLPTTTGGTVYINPASVDAVADGTIAHPYKTWIGITFEANKSYLQLRGTSQTIPGSLSTITAANVIIGAYGDEELPRPIIISTSSSSNNRVIQFNEGYGMVKDMDIRGTTRYGHGIFFKSSNPYAYVYNCNVQGFAVPIYTQYGGADVSLNNIDIWGDLYILYSTIHDCWSDGIYCDDIEDVEIAHCHIYNVNKAYFTNVGNDSPAGAPGDNIQFATGGTTTNPDKTLTFNIHHNIIDHSSTGHKFCIIWASENGLANGSIHHNIIRAAYGNQAITVPGGCVYHGISTGQVLVYNNLIEDGTNCMFMESANVTAYYNIFRNSSRALAVRNSGAGYKTYNNIFDLYATSGLSSYNGTTISKNNVFLSTTAPAYYGTATTMQSDYNHFAGRVNSSRANLLAWQQASIYDDNSSAGVPYVQYADTGNYRPQEGSPLIATGVDVDIAIDFDDAAVTPPVNKGVYQNTEAPPEGGVEETPPSGNYYIDPTYTSSPRDGSHSTPWNAWSEIIWADSSEYRFKCGTTTYASSFTTDEDLSYVSIGTYGTGTRPKLIATANNTTSDVLHLSGDLNVVSIDSLELLNQSGNMYSVLRFSGVSDSITVNGCYIRNAQFGIVFNPVITASTDRITNAVINDCNIYSLKVTGISATRCSIFTATYNNIFSINSSWFPGATVAQAPGCGIELSYCNNANISGNTIDRHLTGNNHCVSVLNYNNVPDNTLQISTNVLYTPLKTTYGGSGVYLYNLPGSLVVDFDFNDIHGEGTQGLPGLWVNSPGIIYSRGCSYNSLQRGIYQTGTAADVYSMDDAFISVGSNVSGDVTILF